MTVITIANKRTTKLEFIAPDTSKSLKAISNGDFFIT